MENNTSLEKELMEEETCPVCGGNHHHHDHEECDHDHDHHDHEECDHDHHHHDHEECDHDIIITTMRNAAMTIIITTMRNAATTITIMTIIMITRSAATIITMTTMATIMQMKVFTSWGRETVKVYSKEEIQKILDTLSADQSYGMVLRAKGMVEGSDGQWIYFDMVPGEADIRQGAPDYTGRLCVIGSKLAEDKLAELFSV